MNSPEQDDCNLCNIVANYGSWALLVLGAVLSLLSLAEWLSALGAYMIVGGLALQLLRTVYLLFRFRNRPSQ